MHVVSVKKKSKKSIEAREPHMQEISEGLMKEELVDKEQLGSDTCKLGLANSIIAATNSVIHGLIS